MAYWQAFLLLLLCVSELFAVFTDKNIFWTTRDEAIPHLTLASISGDPATIRDRNWTIETLQGFNGRMKTQAYSLTFHYKDRKIYYCDFEDDTIYQVTTNKAITAFHRGYECGFQIAVDWSAWNIYLADDVYNWIAIKPLHGGDLYDFKVLVDSEVELPLGIAVDPSRGYVFWTENGKKPRLRRATLDGTDLRVIAFGGLVNPASVSIDPLTGKVFWVDYLKATVEGCRPDGSERTVLIRLRTLQLIGISYYQNHIYITERRNTQIVALRDSGRVKYSIPVGRYGTPQSVTVYARESQPDITDPCLTRGCQHFCVKTLTSGRCLCQDGYTLANDGISCSGPYVYAAKVLAFANRTHVCFDNITVVNRGNSVSPNCPVEAGSGITAIAPDSNGGLVYYAEKNRGQISSVSLRTGTSANIYDKAGRVEGLAFDWLRRVIYWTDSGTKQIKSYDIAERRATIILQTSDNLGRITVDPYDNRLFWITRRPARIKAVTPGQTSVETIASSSPANPHDIEYDFNSQRILWTDDNSVRSVFTNGTNEIQLIAAISRHNRGLVAYKRQVIWTSYGGRNDSNLDAGVVGSNTHSQRSTMSSVGEVVDICMVDATMQKASRGQCFDNGGCDQYCIPTPSGRECRCGLGYETQSDGTTCTSELFDKNFLLLSDGLNERIYQIDVSSRRISATGVGGEPFHAGVSIDPEALVVYWADTVSRFIKRASLNGTGETIVRDTGGEFADRLAIDPATGNIYYTANFQDPQDPFNRDHTNSFVSVISPDGGIHKKLITGLNQPRAIALYSSRGIMFWSDHGTSEIERANMDGSERRSIITTDIEWPNGIAIDFASDQLYWTDAKRGTIERCSLFGTRRVRLVTDKVSLMTGIVIHGDRLYYIGWNLRGVKIVNKSDGSDLGYLVESPLFGELTDIFMLGPLTTMPANQACAIANGGCSTLCLPTSVGKTCACQDGVSLLPDQLTCQGVTRCPSVVLNGRLSESCRRLSGSLCSVDCNDGFGANSLVASYEIRCLSSGQWNTSINTVCSPVTRCPSVVLNGRLSESCSRLSGSFCSVKCNDGFGPNSLVASYGIRCLSNGQWNTSINTVCSPEAIAEDSTIAIAAITSVTIIVVVVVIVIAVVIICKRKRRRRENSDTHRVVYTVPRYNGQAIPGIAGIDNSGYSTVDDPPPYDHELPSGHGFLYTHPCPSSPTEKDNYEIPVNSDAQYENFGRYGY